MVRGGSGAAGLNGLPRPPRRGHGCGRGTRRTPPPTKPRDRSRERACRRWARVVGPRRGAVPQRRCRAETQRQYALADARASRSGDRPAAHPARRRASAAWHRGCPRHCGPPRRAVHVVPAAPGRASTRRLVPRTRPWLRRLPGRGHARPRVPGRPRRPRPGRMTRRRGATPVDRGRPRRSRRQALRALVVGRGSTRRCRSPSERADAETPPGCRPARALRLRQRWHPRRRCRARLPPATTAPDRRRARRRREGGAAAFAPATRGSDGRTLPRFGPTATSIAAWGSRPRDRRG